MRATVLRDPALVKLARRFVWLEVDTERPQNAAFLQKFPIDSYPTFLVVDPATEKPALKWLGTATAPQLEKLLVDGERAIRGAAGESPDALLARADRANAEGRAAEAAEGYRQAIAKGGRSWARRARAVESLVAALGGAERWEDCARVARQEAPSLPRGSSFANAAALGLSCVDSAPADAAWRPDALASLEKLGREALGVPGLLADDRAGLFEALVEARESQGDSGAARRLAERWWRFLAEEARRAPTPEARASLDSYRVVCAVKLGDPARAVPALRASERDLPRDYNPPSRLATLYGEMGKLDDALAASDRALARAYGPRKLRVLEQRAALLEHKGDAAGARAALEEAISYASSLPPPQRPAQAVARIEARLEKMK